MNFLILLVTIFSFQNFHSQTYFEVFAGAGYYSNLDNINKTLYKYNVTRDWLTKKMDGVNRTIFTGWEVVIGNPEKFMEFGFYTFKKNTHAMGPQPDFGNIIGRRDVKIASSGMYYGILWRIQEADKSDFILSFAPVMEFATSRTIYTENIENENVFEKTTSFSMTWGLRLSASYKYFPVHWLGFVIKPTYHFTGKMLVNDIHNNIVNLKGVYPADLADRFSHISMSLGICISVGRY